MLTRKERLLEALEMVFKELETDLINIHREATMYLNNSEACKDDKARLRQCLDEFAENYLERKCLN